MGNKSCEQFREQVDEADVPEPELGQLIIRDDDQLSYEADAVFSMGCSK